MIKSLLIASLAGLLACAPVSAQETSRKKAHAAKKEKAVTGPACKAPAVGSCAACNITCRPGETATCASGQVSADQCITQPLCRCR